MLPHLTSCKSLPLRATQIESMVGSEGLSSLLLELLKSTLFVPLREVGRLSTRCEHRGGDTEEFINLRLGHRPTHTAVAEKCVPSARVLASNH